MDAQSQERLSRQCKDILEHMQKYGKINLYSALNKYDCARLAARICDLRKQGHPIKTNMVYKKDRHGKTVHYAEYSLVV